MCVLLNNNSIILCSLHLPLLFQSISKSYPEARSIFSPAFASPSVFSFVSIWKVPLQSLAKVHRASKRHGQSPVYLRNHADHSNAAAGASNLARNAVMPRRHGESPPSSDCVLGAFAQLSIVRTCYLQRRVIAMRAAGTLGCVR